jgi:predicted ATPase with chaperone activity
MSLAAAPQIHLDRNPEPARATDTGLGRDILIDLALKTLHQFGRLTRSELAESMCVSGSAMQDVVAVLSQDGLATVLGSDGGGPASFQYSLTDKGLDRAEAALARNGYVGPAPVPLEQYLMRVAVQRAPQEAMTRETVEQALARVVLPGDLMDRIGRAVASRRPTLLYGASGNGKTTIARALGEAVEGDILIPHAIEVMGQIVRLYDPSKHVLAPEPAAADLAHGIMKVRGDARWVRIKRPVIWAGGELTRHSLELVRDESGVYEAPLQLKANGGTLIIDDSGRQQMPATQLLNRWIGALEGGRDHLTLHTGQTVEVPFDVLVLFSTNLQPADIADEAFLRRIRYKVEVTNPGAADYARIFALECERHGVHAADGAIAHLMARWFGAGRELRGCQPRDLIEAIVDAARYDGRAPELTAASIDAACGSYFTV